MQRKNYSISKNRHELNRYVSHPIPTYKRLKKKPENTLRVVTNILILLLLKLIKLLFPRLEYLKLTNSYNINIDRKLTILNLTVFVVTQVVPAKIVSFGGLIERPWRTSIKLPCTAVGQPTIKRQWLKSYRAIQSWDGNLEVMENGDMAIASLQRSNSDNYTCHVENIHGADAIIYQIIVQSEFGAIHFQHKTNLRIYLYIITVCVYQNLSQLKFAPYRTTGQSSNRCLSLI